MLSEQSVLAFSEAALSPDPDLATAALMIARIEYPHLDAARYLHQLDVMGREARRRLAAAAETARASDAPARVDARRYAQVTALNEYLFSELRFTGNETRYEDPRNSFLNEVLDRRTGIPITLALLYIEVARRAGLPVEGVNFPGHFLLRCPPGGGVSNADDLIIDAFHGGALLTPDVLRRQAAPADAVDDPHPVLVDSAALPHAGKLQILSRMLLNLKRVYMRMLSFPQARDITQLMIAVNPSALDELRDRGLLAFQLKDFSAALRDLSLYLERSGTSKLDDEDKDDHTQIWEHVKTLRRRVASFN